MLIGYARVSSLGQSLAVQREKLLAAGVEVEHLYEEKVSGATRQRPALRECLRYVRDTDVLLVTRLDRLGRSLLDLCIIVAELERKGTQLKVLDNSFDTTTAQGRLHFQIAAAFAEFERTLIKERQQEGIVAAKKRGVKFGRAFTLTAFQVEALRQRRASGALIRELMEDYQISKASVYRYLAQAPTLDFEAAD
jgi:DNA invertase Pin-like site-specific DNA recombinase